MHVHFFMYKIFMILKLVFFFFFFLSLIITYAEYEVKKTLLKLYF